MRIKTGSKKRGIVGGKMGRPKQKVSVFGH